MHPETRLHEAGIASNRISSRYGEFFLIRVHTARQAPRAGSSGIYRDNFLWLFFFLGLVLGPQGLEGPFLLVDFIGKDTKIGNGC